MTLAPRLSTAPRSTRSSGERIQDHPRQQGGANLTLVHPFAGDDPHPPESPGREASRRAAAVWAGFVLLLACGGARGKPPAPPAPGAGPPAAGVEGPASRLPSEAALRAPLRLVPFLMAHDAATTYRRDYDLLGELLPSQVQTQPEGGFTALLDCGVRAFDLRPCRTRQGNLYMHHGPVTIKRRLEDGLREITDWAGKHPEDLVLVYISHCGGGFGCTGGTGRPNEGCDEATADVLRKLGITRLPSVDISYGEAREMARLASGGRVAAFDQARENYEASIQYCEGARRKSSAMADLFTYMDRIAAEPPAPDELAITQAHWQDPYTTLVDGCAKTVLEMEAASGLNRELARRIAAGQWPHLNLLEVDNACDDGPALKAALHARFARQVAGESKAPLR